MNAIRRIVQTLLVLTLALSVAGIETQALAASQDPLPSQEPITTLSTPTQDAVSLEQGIEVLQASLRQVPSRDDYWLSADLSVQLNPTLTDRKSVV